MRYMAKIEKAVFEVYGAFFVLRAPYQLVYGIAILGRQYSCHSTVQYPRMRQLLLALVALLGLVVSMRDQSIAVKVSHFYIIGYS